MTNLFPLNHNNTLKSAFLSKILTQLFNLKESKGIVVKTGLVKLQIEFEIT